MMKRAAAALAAILVGAFALFVPVAQAAEPISGETITIDENIADDVYAAGESVTVDAVVEGDLVVAANDLTINGEVTGDLIFAGQWMRMNGQIGDDMRAAGGVLFIDGTVGDDATTAGYAVMFGPESVVNGDLLAGAGQLRVNDVNGSVLGGGGAVQLNGQITGDVQVGVGDQPLTNPYQFMPDMPSFETLPAGLTLGEDVLIEGDLDYTSPQRAEITRNVVAGETLYSEPVTTEADTGPAPAVAALLRYVAAFATTLIAGIVLGAIAPGFVRDARENIEERLAASAGVGLLGYIAAGVLILVAVVLTGFMVAFAGVTASPLRLTGLATNVIATGFGVLTRWVAPVLLGLIVGRALFGEQENLLPLAVGLAIVALVFAIPAPWSALPIALIGIVGLGAALLALFSSEQPEPIREPAPANGQQPAPAAG